MRDLAAVVSLARFGQFHDGALGEFSKAFPARLDVLDGFTLYDSKRICN